MTIFGVEFANRHEAGSRLAAKLAHLKAAHPLVLALPRGGVPVAWEVAHALDAPLDLLIVRKIGAPGHEELGIGAIVDGANPQLVLNEDVLRTLHIPPGYIEREKERQLAEIERRRRAYIGTRPPADPAGRTVILVDDGIATGGTVKVALKALRQGHPARLVLAVPVAPADSLARLSAECDEVVCLSMPEPFYAVGAHYADFTQTTDAEVVGLMAKADERTASGPDHG